MNDEQQAILENRKRFPVNYPDARKKLHCKRVKLIVEHRGKPFELFGEFNVLPTDLPEPEYISVRVDSVFPDDPPLTAGRMYHLSQAHVASIVGANDPKAKFEIQLPFYEANACPSPGKGRSTPS